MGILVPSSKSSYTNFGDATEKSFETVTCRLNLTGVCIAYYLDKIFFFFLGEEKIDVMNQNYDVEERQRRRIFAHYDCQSLTANLGYAAKLRGLLLARRRNTTTGASAASMLGTRSTTPDGDSGDEDLGDGTSNELIEKSVKKNTLIFILKNRFDNFSWQSKNLTESKFNLFIKNFH